MKKFKTKFLNRINMHKVLSTFLAVMILFYSFSLSVIPVNALENTQYQSQINNEELLSEVRAIIKTYYLNIGSQEALSSVNIKEMISKLNDPYSTYFTKEEYDEFINGIDNRFVGIGIRVEASEEGLKIIDVIKNSPAEEVGIKAKDIILEANSTSLVGLPSEEAVKYIKGEEGTKVTILVKRENIILEYIVTRKAISMPTVEWEIVNKVGHIYIYSFGEKTGSEFEGALNTLNLNGVEGYVVDIRNNSGGYIYTALDIGGYFIGNDPMVLMKDKEKNVSTFNGFYHDEIIDKPVIFLINEYSASASELLSAALKDYKKAFFIGKTTYGKGVAQSMFGLSDGGIIKLTTNEFFSPYGKTINKVGVTPDLPIEDDSIDPTVVAKLLFSSIGKEKEIEDYKSKAGYVKIKIEDSIFYINLNEVIKDENWEAYSYILENVKSEDIYIGSENGWTSTTENEIENKLPLFYPQHKNFMDITKSKYDKSIAITFNNFLDVNTVNENSVQLVDSKTGEIVATNLKVDSKNKIVVTLETELKEGETYFLLISKDVKSEKGLGLNKDVVSRVTIKN